MRKDTRLSTLFRTASDEKLGGAWERGYHIDTLKTQRCYEQAYSTHKLKVLHSYIPQTEQRVPEGRMLFCLRNVTYLLRASCLMLEINEFRCYEAKIEESEKTGSRWESNPGHL